MSKLWALTCPSCPNPVVATPDRPLQCDMVLCMCVVYSEVRDLGAVLSSTAGSGSMWNITWRAPVEDELYHATLHYHLTFTPLDLPPHYFTISTAEV